MKIALVQTSLEWENPKVNREQLAEKFNSITQAVDLIVLPEMFSSGFTMNPGLVAEDMQGPSMQWLKEWAKRKEAAICGSLVICEGNCYYNRLVFVFPCGNVQCYDKKHLFSLAKEDRIYTAGRERLIVEYRGWRICPLICYDLRFPVFSRNTEDYELLLYVANWPKQRILAWDALLKARAIENMSYTLGVNRLGIDGNQQHYNGHSQLIDYLGAYLLEPIKSNGVYIVELDKEKLVQAREQFNFLSDRDAFVLE